MANTYRGEGRIAVLGKEYTLKYDTNALAEFEELMHSNMTVIGKRMESGDMGIRDLRALFWSGLRRYHPEVNLKKAGDLMDEAGRNVIAEAVLTVFQSAMPEVKNADGKPENPPKAAGTL